MTNIGLQIQFPIDVCVYMNIHNHIPYVVTHVHTWISTPALYQDTLDLSDISDFEDVMTTSSDKDIPTLEDVFGL